MRTYHFDGTLPEDDAIFVFGSNTRGWHGKGAALVAQEKYGAIRNIGSGFMGRCYAIPTKGYSYAIKRLVRLDLETIKRNIEVFCEFTIQRPDLNFFVTAVGCGLANYEADQIAPLFKDAINCSFPDDWDIFLED